MQGIVILYVFAFFFFAAQVWKAPLPPCFAAAFLVLGTWWVLGTCMWVIVAICCFSSGNPWLPASKLDVTLSHWFQEKDI